MEVKIKDREEEIEYVRMALNMVEIGVDYQTSDLIIRVLNAIGKNKGQFTVDECINIQYKWKEDWRKYFENQPSKNT